MIADRPCGGAIHRTSQRFGGDTFTKFVDMAHAHLEDRECATLPAPFALTFARTRYIHGGSTPVLNDHNQA